MKTSENKILVLGLKFYVNLFNISLSKDYISTDDVNDWSISEVVDTFTKWVGSEVLKIVHLVARGTRAELLKSEKTTTMSSKNSSNESVSSENSTEETVTTSKKSKFLKACSSEALFSSVLDSVESVYGSSDSITTDFLEIVLIVNVCLKISLVILDVLDVGGVNVSVCDTLCWTGMLAHFRYLFVN